MAVKPLPSQEYLRQRLDYEPESGELRWRRRPVDDFSDEPHARAWNTKYAGEIAGNLNNHGYRRLRLDATEYIVSRVIWKMMTGEEPETVDHRNHQTSSTRWGDLRAASRTQNQQNRYVHLNRKRGATLKGAYWTKTGWLAKLQFDRRRVHIGIFDTEEEAHAAYCAKARELFGEFAHDGRRPVNSQS